jgi:hypothetical protein
MVVMTIGFVTAMNRIAVAVIPWASATWKRIGSGSRMGTFGTGPGVPLIVAVGEPGLNIKPCGRLPDAIDHV